VVLLYRFYLIPITSVECLPMKIFWFGKKKMTLVPEMSWHLLGPWHLWKEWWRCYSSQLCCAYEQTRNHSLTINMMWYWKCLTRNSYDVKQSIQSDTSRRSRSRRLWIWIYNQIQAGHSFTKANHFTKRKTCNMQTIHKTEFLSQADTICDKISTRRKEYCRFYAYFLIKKYSKIAAELNV